MALKVVQDTSTNWTAAEWREIESLKKVLAESDNRSGRPWVIGAKVNKLAPLLTDGPRGFGRRSVGIGTGSLPSRDPERLRDLALEVGETPVYLAKRANVEMTWAPEDRVPGVGWGVFYILAPNPDRTRILATLLKEKAAFDITRDDARRAQGVTVDTPKTSTERLAAFYTVLDRFPKRLRTQTDINFAKQIINKLYILIGEAEAFEDVG